MSSRLYWAVSLQVQTPSVVAQSVPQGPCMQFVFAVGKRNQLLSKQDRLLRSRLRLLRARIFSLTNNCICMKIDPFSNGQLFSPTVTCLLENFYLPGKQFFLAEYVG